MRCPHCDSFVPEKSRFCSQCGSSLEEKKQTLTYTPAMASRAEERLRFSPGDRFGKRYRIVEEVGRGGMGRVYKAEDKELGITVALKMIRPELSSHSRFIRQFKRETLLARSISHENIIRIHDLGEVQKIKFISMDYIRGQDLRALIQTSGSLVPETAIHIARQICAALHAAHKEGIVHLDLKPQNIMIDSSGRVYVMDFGVARSLAVPQEGTSRAFIGTPPYMSPEQAQKKDVDQRADLYAFGVILFEMLTGRRPFEAETASEYIEKHIHEEPPLPSKINPLIPPFLDKVVLRCLEKDRTRRYQNAAEILEDLGRIKPGAKPALVRARTHAIWRWAAAFAVILVLALGLYLLIGRKKPGPPSFSGGERIPVAVMYFENNTGDEEFDHWRKALCYMIIQDLSQSYYVRVLTGDRLFSILRKLNLTDAETYSAEDLRNVAQEAGVRYIISGDYTKARETFRINAMLQDIATGELIGSTRIQGTGTESFLTMVDEITPWAKSKFNLTQEEIAADLDKNIGEITTTNPEALRFYIQGREYYQEGRIQESNEAFLKAVEKDPGFALAYKRISENYYYLGDIDLAKTYIQKSLALVRRVSERERFLIQGFAQSTLEESYDQAIQTYERMLTYYPEDEEGNIYLGSLYRNREDWDPAVEHFMRILPSNPEIASINLFHIYGKKGEYAKAEEIVHTYRHVFREPVFLMIVSRLYLAQGKYEKAQLALGNALALDRDNDRLAMTMSHVHHLAGDFHRAEAILEGLQEKGDPYISLSSGLWLSRLDLARGKYAECRDALFRGLEEARRLRLKTDELKNLLFLAYVELQRKEFDNALLMAQEAEEVAEEVVSPTDRVSAIHLRGWAYHLSGDAGKARKAAEEIRQKVEETGHTKLMLYYHHLAGLIALESGALGDAVRELEEAVSFLPHQIGMEDSHALYLYSLARALYQRQDRERARSVFEKVLSLSTGRLGWGNLYALSHYWLGKLHQQEGRTQEALGQYERFLELWKEADPGLPALRDAREQLSSLSERLPE